MPTIGNLISFILKAPIILRKIIIIFLDVCCIKFSAFFSIILFTGEFNNNIFLDNSLIISFASLTGPVIYLISGQYRGIIRYTNSKEIFKIFFRNLLLIIILFWFSIIFNLNSLSLSMLVIFFVVLTYLISASRFLLRELIFLSQLGDFNKRKRLDRMNVVIVTSIERKSQTIDFFSHDPKYKVLAIIDTSLIGVGRYLYGIPVKNKSYLNKIKANVDKVLIDKTSISNKTKNEILNLINELKLPIYSIPSFNQFLNSNNLSRDLKPFTINDLLGREEVLPNKDLYGPNILGKNILITGGGGSIGRELALQIIRLKASRVIILELNEFNLHEINYELNQIAKLEKLNVDIVSLLGSACDEFLIRDIFEKYNINTIFHAAAYKHVSIVENNPIQGLKNNIKSTHILCKFAYSYKIDSIMLISTDKAVRPTNIMGASKRISELIIQAYNHKSKNEVKTIFSLVRFGNVIGSSGSVIPIFLRQIKEGGPLSVTHEKVIRYFMTIPKL